MVCFGRIKRANVKCNSQSGYKRVNTKTRLNKSANRIVNWTKSTNIAVLKNIWLLTESRSSQPACTHSSARKWCQNLHLVFWTFIFFSSFFFKCIYTEKREADCQLCNFSAALARETDDGCIWRFFHYASDLGYTWTYPDLLFWGVKRTEKDLWCFDSSHV